MIDSTPGVFENAQVDIYLLVPDKIGQYKHISLPPPPPPPPVRPLGQEQWGQRNKIIKKSKV